MGTTGLFKGVILSALTGLVVFATLPATSNYMLNSYGFGSGGTANSTTSNYGLEGITGELSGQPQSTSNYADKPGYVQTQQANVPKVSLSNPSNYYDKLKFVIDAQGNPSDAKFALQIGTGGSSCSTGTVNYVKSDDTIGATLTSSDYQTYSSWGGASGETIIGLAANATYYLCAKATQGTYTESAYGPSSSAATVGQQLSYCLYLSSASCGSGGNTEAFGSLLSGSVNNSPSNLAVDFATNANGGGAIYIYAAYGGLKSTRANYTMTSSTADLSSASEGFGAQVTSASQSSGGPFASVSPYNGSSNNVGGVSTTAATILKSSVPLTGGQGQVQLKVKPSSTTPEAADYAETLTLIAAAAF